MLLQGTSFLIAAALALRVCAAALRAPPDRMPLRLAGWILGGFAAWFAAGAAAAWAPFWPPVLAAAILALPSPSRAVRLALWPVADVMFVIGLGLISTPPLAPARFAVAALVLAAIGLACDLVLERLPALLRRIARWAAAPAVMGVLAFLVLALVPPLGERQPRDRAEFVSLYSGIMPEALPGERRVVLETGAVAWLDRPRGDGPFPGALFFHGAHPSGAHQPAALAARRALLDAGLVTLAVDHPGYGDSPHPGPEAPAEAWNPLPTDLAAYETLTAMPDVRGVTAVGHSMGNQDVLRLLNADVPLDAAVMMGAALPDPDADPEYWRGRFFADRRMGEPTQAIPVHEIRSLFYDAGRYARQLPPSHPPVHFVTFGIEWPNVAEMRGPLYDLLPGPKEIWHLPETTHYLSADDVAALALVVGETRATRELGARLRQRRGRSE